MGGEELRAGEGGEESRCGARGGRGYGLGWYSVAATGGTVLTFGKVSAAGDPLRCRSSAQRGTRRSPAGAVQAVGARTHPRRGFPVRANGGLTCGITRASFGYTTCAQGASFSDIPV